MIQEKDILLAIKEVAQNNGFGTVVCIYNDIEQKWHNYVGEFKPKNPSNHIYFNSINAKCVDYIIENKHVYFTGDMAKNDLISSKLEQLPKETIEFDFRFVWLK